jgi:hypothetical protein
MPATKRKSRKNRSPRRPLFECDKVMYDLCAMACGKRLGVAGERYMVIVKGRDPDRGSRVKPEELAALEARGWVAPSADGLTMYCTPEGRKWAAVWFRRKHRMSLDQAEPDVQDEVSHLLAKEA